MFAKKYLLRLTIYLLDLIITESEMSKTNILHRNLALFLLNFFRARALCVKIRTHVEFAFSTAASNAHVNEYITSSCERPESNRILSDGWKCNSRDAGELSQKMGMDLVSRCCETLRARGEGKEKRTGLGRVCRPYANERVP